MTQHKPPLRTRIRLTAERDGLAWKACTLEEWRAYCNARPSVAKLGGITRRLDSRELVAFGWAQTAGGAWRVVSCALTAATLPAFAQRFTAEDQLRLRGWLAEVRAQVAAGALAVQLPPEVEESPGSTQQ